MSEGHWNDDFWRASAEKDRQPVTWAEALKAAVFWAAVVVIVYLVLTLS